MAKLDGLGERVFSGLQHSIWDANLTDKDLSRSAAQKLERDGKPGLGMADLKMYFDGMDEPTSPRTAKDRALAEVVKDAQEADDARADAELKKPIGPFELLFAIMVPIFGWLWLWMKSGNTEERYEKAQANVEPKRQALRQAVETYAAM
jgi:hypothetical protein